MQLQKAEVEAEWGPCDSKQCTGDGALERSGPVCCHMQAGLGK